MRQKKLRATPQRLFILQGLERLEQEGQHRHLSARDVFEAVQETLPGLNVTTVYRTLEDLNQAGLVDSISTSKDQVRFSLRRQDHRHGHLACRTCGKVTTVGLSVFEDLSRRLADEHGFALTLDHLTLSGQCRECSSTHA